MDGMLSQTFAIIRPIGPAIHATTPHRWKDPKMAARYAANELAATGAVAWYFEDDDR